VDISLIAGSGFGAADDVWPYMTGDWAVKSYGVQPMPFDGVLFVSRVMVTKEAHTCSSRSPLLRPVWMRPTGKVPTASPSAVS
jgi:fatty acid synthase subunit alpha